MKYKKRGKQLIPKHMWTKGEMKTVINMWENTSREDLSATLGIEVSQLSYMASQLRKYGIALPRKRKVGNQGELIQELVAELKGKTRR